jgi:hypothetical protein
MIIFNNEVQKNVKTYSCLLVMIIVINQEVEADNDQRWPSMLNACMCIQ